MMRTSLATAGGLSYFGALAHNPQDYQTIPSCCSIIQTPHLDAVFLTVLLRSLRGFRTFGRVYVESSPLVFSTSLDMLGPNQDEGMFRKAWLKLPVYQRGKIKYCTLCFKEAVGLHRPSDDWRNASVLRHRHN